MPEIVMIEITPNNVRKKDGSVLCQTCNNGIFGHHDISIPVRKEKLNNQIILITTFKCENEHIFEAYTYLK